MAGLAVNVDHIATLREARKTTYPDPVGAAVLAEMAGADGIVVHLREDRRHIQDRDVKMIRDVVQSKMILEMAATPEMVAIAHEVKPDIVTLVPEKREEVTTEGGLDLLVHKTTVLEAVEALQENGIYVSIFLDPDPEQIKIAHKTGAAMIEIHTGAFCDAKTRKRRGDEFDRIIDAAKLAYKLNLGVNAGHGICYNSIKKFKGLREIDEFSIGHSIVARASFVGMEKAVKEMVSLIKAL